MPASLTAPEQEVQSQSTLWQIQVSENIYNV